MLTFDEGTHTYRWMFEIVPSVTQIISGGGGGVDYSGIPRHILERAAEIGTEVHKSVEVFHDALLQGDKASLETHDASAAEYLLGYAQFLEDTGFRALHTEKKLYSHKGYAGTVDLIGEIYDRRCIADIKTTSKLHTDTTELQLAAYKYLAEENGLGPIDDKYIIWLKKSGSNRYELVPMNDELAIHRFLSMVEEYHGND